MEICSLQVGGEEGGLLVTMDTASSGTQYIPVCQFIIPIQ